jgi:tRNA pseudouridine55 synthase
MSKTYRSIFRLGAKSSTDDADGTITPMQVSQAPAFAVLAERLQAFVGPIEQTPPAYSAAKVTGRRAYALARKGDMVNLQARTIHIHGIDLLRYEFPELELEVRCGKGTYIRSLARDVGDRLECGAYVQVLRRTRVGPFAAEEGVSLDAPAAEAHSRIMPMGLAVAELPGVTLPAPELQRLCAGQAVSFPCSHKDKCEIAVWDETGELAAVAGWDVDMACLRPFKVLRDQLK